MGFMIAASGVEWQSECHFGLLHARPADKLPVARGHPRTERSDALPPRRQFGERRGRSASRRVQAPLGLAPAKTTDTTRRVVSTMTSRRVRGEQHAPLK